MLKIGIWGIVIEYLVVFIIILFANFLLYVRKNRTYNKDKVPTELKYLISLYKISIEKINYKKFLWIFSLTNTFIITSVYIIIMYLIKKLIFQILFGVILLVLLTIICYGIIGRIYEKKGDKNV